MIHKIYLEMFIILMDISIHILWCEYYWIQSFLILFFMFIFAVIGRGSEGWEACVHMCVCIPQVIHMESKHNAVPNTLICFTDLLQWSCSVNRVFAIYRPQSGLVSLWLCMTLPFSEKDVEPGIASSAWALSLDLNMASNCPLSSSSLKELSIARTTWPETGFQGKCFGLTTAYNCQKQVLQTIPGFVLLWPALPESSVCCKGCAARANFCVWIHSLADIGKYKCKSTLTEAHWSLGRKGAFLLVLRNFELGLFESI